MSRNGVRNNILGKGEEGRGALNATPQKVDYYDEKVVGLNPLNKGQRFFKLSSVISHWLIKSGMWTLSSLISVSTLDL